MKIYRTETHVVTNGGNTFVIEGHVNEAEIVKHIQEKIATYKAAWPDTPRYDENVDLSGAAAHLAQDSSESIRNFGFNAKYPGAIVKAAQ